MFDFCRKDSSYSKMSKKPSDDAEKERLASHQCERSCEAVGVIGGCGVVLPTALCWLLMHDELYFFCSVSSLRRVNLGINRIFPFIRNDSSDSKAPVLKKHSVDVKKERHRCAGVGL